MILSPRRTVRISAVSVFQVLSVAARGAPAPCAQALEVVWDGDSLDWKEIPADEICQRVVSRVGPGSIVLFHNAAIHTPEALPRIIETLLQEGYTFVPISQLILPGTYNTDYTIDHTGRQLPCQSGG